MEIKKVDLLLTATFFAEIYLSVKLLVTTTCLKIRNTSSAGVNTIKLAMVSLGKLWAPFVTKCESD